MSHPITSVLILTALKVSNFARLGNCCEVTSTNTILSELQYSTCQSVFSTNTILSPVSLANLPFVCVWGGCCIWHDFKNWRL